MELGGCSAAGFRTSHFLLRTEYYLTMFGWAKDGAVVIPLLNTVFFRFDEGRLGIVREMIPSKIEPVHVASTHQRTVRFPGSE